MKQIKLNPLVEDDNGSTKKYQTIGREKYYYNIQGHTHAGKGIIR